MKSKLVESVVDTLMLQLKSHRAVARSNAVKTLASFGLCRKNIILSMLIPMADEDESVRQEAMEAVSRLAGIKSRTGLVNYLDSIGALPDYHVQEKEVIEELKERYTHSPAHRPLIHHSLLNLLGKRGLQMKMQQRLKDDDEEEDDEEETEQLFPCGDELPVESPTEFINTWFSEISPNVGAPPDEEDPVKLQKEMRLPKMRAKHAKKRADRPPRRRPQRQAPGEPSPARDTACSSSDTSSATSMQGLTAEEAEEARDQFEETWRLSDISMEHGPNLSDPSLGSTDQSGSMGQSLSFGSGSTRSSERRRTIHMDMMDCRKASLAKEKEHLVSDMKEKLRKHRERYVELMTQRKRERAATTSMPHIKNIYKYEQRATLQSRHEESSTTTSSDMTLSDLTLSETRMKIESTITVHSESGVGVSYYGGSSALLTDTDAKTGCDVSSGFITDHESLIQDVTSANRPKSSLTVENVRRFESKSAKGKKKRKKKEKEVRLPEVRTKKEVKAPYNWRELFLQLLLKHSEKPHTTQQERSKAAEIKCIPSDVTLVPGETDERLLHTITLCGGYSGQKETEHERGLGLLASNREYGVSKFGKLEFTWTTQTTEEEVKVLESGDQIGTESMTASSTIRSKATDKAVQKAWLQQHLLFPSLYKLRALDENKRQCAMLRKLHQTGIYRKDNVTYQWDISEPVACPPSQRLSNIDMLSEIKKSQQWKKRDSNEKRTPLGGKHYHLPYLQLSLPGPEPPIVPRNSTVSHHGNVLTLPKLLSTDGKYITDEMESLSEETLAN